MDIDVMSDAGINWLQTIEILSDSGHQLVGLWMCYE